MRELIGPDFDIDEDGVPRLHRGTRQDRILSVHDPEMRHGRKSRQQRFDGYKLSAAATSGAERLITAVEVVPANAQDGRQAAALVEHQDEQTRPERLLGDTAYGTGPVRAKLAEHDVEVLAPVPEGPAKPGRLTKRDFTVDLEAGLVICPAGHTAPSEESPLASAAPPSPGRRAGIVRCAPAAWARGRRANSCGSRLRKSC